MHNTHGERHSYVLPACAEASAGGRVGNDGALIRQQAPKAFYVSPFLSMDCAYHFKIRPPGDDVLIAIHEQEAGKPILSATFSGQRKPLTDGALPGMLLRHP